MERGRKGGIIALLGIIMIVVILLYPYLYGGETQEGAKLIISMNFGKQILREMNIETNISVMKALEENANITTAYGGTFVSSIDGIAQNSTCFWFYYVNGILAKVGAQDYVIHPGDVIRWDYHMWKNTITYAEVEDFPEPLVHGYGGERKSTMIVYQKNYKTYAEELKTHLAKLGVNITLTTEFNGKYNGNIIVMGYPEIANIINQNHKKLGLRYHVENSLILDPYGNRYRGAFVEATQSPFTPGGVGSCQGVIIWLYSTSTNYMENAIAILMKDEIKSFWYFSGEEI